MEELNYSVSENGWTLFIDSDLKNITLSQAAKLRKLIASNTLVIARNQILNTDDQIELAKKIGELNVIYDKTKSTSEQPITQYAENEHIFRISGVRDDKGNFTGLSASEKVLDWHCDMIAKKNRVPVLQLYGYEGTNGSCTSFVNTVEAYKKMSETLKRKIQDIKIVCGKPYNSTDPFRYQETVGALYKKGSTCTFDLVIKNQAGNTGLFFPFFQILEIERYTRDEAKSLIEEIKKEVMKEEFIYHHHWQDGDVILSDQWLNIHKRWPFNGITSRTLHRIGIWTEESKLDSKK